MAPTPSLFTLKRRTYWTLRRAGASPAVARAVIRRSIAKTRKGR